MLDHTPDMILGHEQRLSKAEERLDMHEATLGKLDESLNKLNSNFAQIKNWLIGAISFYILQQMGFVDFIRGLL